MSSNELVSAPDQSADVKLSICIATYNRAPFIADTLNSIIDQATNECEIVVSDNASTDDTERVVKECGKRSHRLRYIRQEKNGGMDRNFDDVVRRARGEYCWLMTDDDLVKPGAIAAILAAVSKHLSLIIMTTEVRDYTLSKVLEPKWPNFDSDRIYRPEELDRLFVDIRGPLNINAIVFKRQLWIERETARFYGSLFIHMAVAFQERLPADALLIAQPYITYRAGNVQTYSSFVGELVWVTWPWIVENMAISDEARKKLSSPKPWRHFQELLVYRARGLYSCEEHRKWVRPRLHSMCEIFIAQLVVLIPGLLANVICMIFYSIPGVRWRGVWGSKVMRYWLRASRFHIGNRSPFRRKNHHSNEPTLNEAIR